MKCVVDQWKTDEMPSEWNMFHLGTGLGMTWVEAHVTGDNFVG